MGLFYPDVSWIIARDRGLDGTSILHHNAVDLLNRQGKSVLTTTGEEQDELEAFDTKQDPTILVPELSFHHPTSEQLYAYSFTGVPVDQDAWLHQHEEHAESIEQKLEDIVADKRSPVIIHNLLSLREFHPQAAIGMRRLIEKHPEVPFISYAPDSSFERPERTSQMHPFVLDEIVGSRGKQDNLGPYHFDNLYHLVVNKAQEKRFARDYHIPQDHIFRMHDFLPFESSEPPEIPAADAQFLDFLAEHGTYMDGRTMQQQTVDIGDHPTFFLEAVRPIERKKIKTAIYIAHLYSKKTHRRTPVVITHPNGDEGGTYLNECIRLGNRLDVPVIYLGDTLKPISKPDASGYDLWDVYRNMSALNTIGMVLSTRGAWENTVNEGIKFMIPEYVNPMLPSYKEIRDMGIDIHGEYMDPINRFVETTQPEDLKHIVIPEVTNALAWIEHLERDHVRKDITAQNYRQAYQHLSTEAVTPYFMHMLKRIA